MPQTDLAVTHATLTQLTVPHLETKEEPNFVNTSCTIKVVPSEEKLYRIVWGSVHNYYMQSSNISFIHHRWDWSLYMSS